MSTQNSWNNGIAAANSAITLNSGTNTIGIGTDATNNTLNIGTGAGVKTTTLGSATGTSATTVSSGSGALNVTSLGGTLTINSGAGTIGISTDAAPTTVNIATAVAVKTVQLGSTTLSSATIIKSGTGNIALNSGLTVDSTGRMTNTVQPAFFAYLSATQTNTTGNGAYYKVPFDGTLFNVGSGYNTSTHQFTAPVTGKYQFATQVDLKAITIATEYQLNINTTTTAYYVFVGNPSNMKSVAGGEIGANFLFTNQMTAGDTCFVYAYVTGEAGNTNSIRGLGSPNMITTFSGYLIC